MSFETEPGVFSPDSPDKGTLFMLGRAEARAGDKILDLGCGCGIVGIFLAKKYGAAANFCDIDTRCTELTKKNLAANGVSGEVWLGEGFFAVPDSGYSLILCNPPFHADFSVPKSFIEKGFNRLIIGGRMILVTKRRKWYENKLKAVFGGVRVFAEDDYFVFIAEKRQVSYEKRKQRQPR
jgi:16S rRNA (guanine1207-N2)-methyltransferase